MATGTATSGSGGGHGGSGGSLWETGHLVNAPTVAKVEVKAKAKAMTPSSSAESGGDALLVCQHQYQKTTRHASMARHAPPLEAGALAVGDSDYDLGAWSPAEMTPFCGARDVAPRTVGPMALPLPPPASATMGTGIVESISFSGGLGPLAVMAGRSAQVEALIGPEKEEKPIAALQSAAIQGVLRTSASLIPPFASTSICATPSGVYVAELYRAYQKHVMSVSLAQPPAKVAPRGAAVAGLHHEFLQALPSKRPARPEEGGCAAPTKKPRSARRHEGGRRMAQSSGLFKTHGDGQVCTRDSGANQGLDSVSVSVGSPFGKSGDSTCKIKGCASRIQQEGHCIKLAARQQMCGHEGCLKYAQRAGLCISHGEPTKRCSVEGCSNAAQVRGVCRKHGPNLKICTRAGCTNQAIKNGVCMKHGAKVRTCSHEGCTTYAQRGGLCTKHGTKRRRCSWDDCTNQAVRGGVCIRHGAKRRPCIVEGCPNYAQRAGVCVRHGARKKCTVVRPVENEVAVSLLELSEQDASNSNV